jgi:hypothetical protein
MTVSCVLGLHTISHVNTLSLIQKTFISYNLSVDGGTDSTESVLKTEAMARPADTIVPHNMSEHARRFLVFFSLEAGM